MLEYLMLFGFGVLENLILVMFCKIVGDIKGIKYWHMIPIGIIIPLFSMVQIPFVRQSLYSTTILIYLYYISKERFTKIIKWFVFSTMYLLVLETVGCIIYEVFFDVALQNLSLCERLVYLIPIRIIQLFILYIIRRTKNGHVLVGFS